MKNLFLILTASVLAFLSCTKKESTSNLNNSEYKIGIAQEFENLNPLIMQMVATTYLYAMTGRRLVNMDENAKWVPQLVTEIPTLENKKARIVTIGGKKKIVADWEILSNANWGDGKPVICADFALTREIALNPNVSVGDKETYAGIEKIEIDKTNPKKCTFTFARARWDFYQLGTYYPLPSHLEAEVYQKHKNEKEGYEKNSLYSKDPTNPGLFNGPYLISEIKLSDHVTFVPNPHFYGEKPKIQKIIAKLIPNTGTLEANLRSGTIDAISNVGMDFDQATTFDKKVKAEKLPYVVNFVPGLTYEHIDMNLSHPILKDRNVRKALIQGLDRQSLIKSLFDGKQQAAIHSISPKDPWYNETEAIKKETQYSKSLAEKYLEDSGWKKGPDGIRVKDGKKLSLEFSSTAGNKMRELVQVYLQDQWKQIGIEVTIKNYPARVFFGEITKKRKFDLALYAWVSSPESVPRSTFHSSAIPTEKNGWSGQNQPGWSNPVVDAKIEALEVEFDAAKRLELVTRITEEYTKDAPVIPLYYRSEISVTPSKLKNFIMTGHQFYETNAVEKWTLE